MNKLTLFLLFFTFLANAKDYTVKVLYTFSVHTNNRYQAEEVAMWGDYGDSKSVFLKDWDEVMGQYEPVIWNMHVEVTYTFKNKREMYNHPFVFYSPTGLAYSYVIVYTLVDK